MLNTNILRIGIETDIRRELILRIIFAKPLLDKVLHNGSTGLKARKA